MAHSGNVWSILAAQMRSGDEAARSQLVATVERVLRAFSGARLSRAQEVADRVQNTLLRLDRGVRHELKYPAALKASAPKPRPFRIARPLPGVTGCGSAFVIRRCHAGVLRKPDHPLPGGGS